LGFGLVPDRKRDPQSAIPARTLSRPGSYNNIKHTPPTTATKRRKIAAPICLGPGSTPLCCSCANRYEKPKKKHKAQIKINNNNIFQTTKEINRRKEAPRADSQANRKTKPILTVKHI